MKPLRKGVADLHRHAEVSQRANERYLEALAVIDEPRSCASILDSVARPVLDGPRRFRALRIGAPDDIALLREIARGDIALLREIARGEFATAGFRNRDLRLLLHPDSKAMAQPERRRLSTSISRKLRLLRAQGLIKKVPKTHRNLLTDKGQLLAVAVFATRNADLNQLLSKAA